MILPKFKLCTIVLMGLGLSVNAQDLNELDVMNQKDSDFHSSREVNESTFDSDKTLDTVQIEISGVGKNNFRHNSLLITRVRSAREFFTFIYRLSGSKILEIPTKLMDRFSKTINIIGRSVKEALAEISAVQNQQ